MKQMLLMVLIVCFLLCGCSAPVQNEEHTTANELQQSEPIIPQSEMKEISPELVPLQGEWKSTKSNWHLIINDRKVDALYYENYEDEADEENHNVYRIENIEEDGSFTVSQKYIYFINDSGLLECHNTKNKIVNTYEKISDRTDLPKINVKTEPYIGMSQTELENSTWGYPKKRNKTTTATTVTEQWVYDKGYIYLTNGYVAVIQEK